MISHNNLCGISKNNLHEISFVNDITLRFAASFISYVHTVLKDFKMTFNRNLYIKVQKGDNTANFLHDKSKPDKKEERRSK